TAPMRSKGGCVTPGASSGADCVDAGAHGIIETSTDHDRRRAMHCTRRTFLLSSLLAGCATLPRGEARPGGLIGYTVHRTNLPTPYENQTPPRARVGGGEGAGARELGGELITGPHQWTQFAGWSPDGGTAV